MFLDREILPQGLTGKIILFQTFRIAIDIHIIDFIKLRVDLRLVISGIDPEILLIAFQRCGIGAFPAVIQPHHLQL